MVREAVGRCTVLGRVHLETTDKCDLRDSDASTHAGSICCSVMRQSLQTIWRQDLDATTSSAAAAAVTSNV